MNFYTQKSHSWRAQRVDCSPTVAICSIVHVVVVSPSSIVLLSPVQPDRTRRRHPPADILCSIVCVWWPRGFPWESHAPRRNPTQCAPPWNDSLQPGAAADFKRRGLTIKRHGRWVSARGRSCRTSASVASRASQPRQPVTGLAVAASGQHSLTHCGEPPAHALAPGRPRLAIHSLRQCLALPRAFDGGSSSSLTHPGWPSSDPSTAPASRPACGGRESVIRCSDAVKRRRFACRRRGHVSEAPRDTWRRCVAHGTDARGRAHQGDAPW